MEQKDVVDEKVTLKIHGKEREIRFTFSAWAKLEEEYGGVKNFVKMQEQIQSAASFPIILHFMLLYRVILCIIVARETVYSATICMNRGTVCHDL